MTEQFDPHYWAEESIVVKLEDPPLDKERPWIVLILDPWDPDREFLMAPYREKTEALANSHAESLKSTLSWLYDSLYEECRE